MESIYSILYCPTRPTVDEKISVALLMIQGNAVYFRYSHDKLDLVKNLISKPAHQLLKSCLSGLEDYINNLRSQATLFTVGSDLFAKQHLEYLSKYANNLIIYSKPVVIDLPATEDVFSNLYSKYIFGADATRDTKNLWVQKAKREIGVKIKDHVNIDIELDSKIIPNLWAPVKIWFAGKNDSIMTGEVINFEKTPRNLGLELQKYQFLIDRILENSDQAIGTYYIVGKEPDKLLVDNHKLWTSVMEHKQMEFVPENEAYETINHYISVHGVKPLVSVLTDSPYN